MRKFALASCVFATFASVGLTGCDNNSICNIWALNAADTVTVTRGSFGVVTINTGTTPTTGAVLSNGTNNVPAGMDAERFNATEFHIFAEPTTPVGTYVINIAGIGGVGNECAQSVPESITVTVN
jgi:hypothetical protein